MRIVWRSPGGGRWTHLAGIAALALLGVGGSGLAADAPAGEVPAILEDYAKAQDAFDRAYAAATTDEERAKAMDRENIT